jgi:hypothetical protein
MNNPTRSWLTLATLGLLTVACGSTGGGSGGTGGSGGEGGGGNGDVAACLAQYIDDELSSEEITALDQGVDDCFSDDPITLEQEAAILPLDAGVDPRNSLTIEIYYACSDVCPDAGYVGISYKDVAEEDCCALGGFAYYEPAFNSYAACLPPEVEGGACDQPL